MQKRLVLCASVLLLGACSSLNDWMAGKDRQPYRTSATLPPLEVPPDLTSPSRDNRYLVPESGPATATLSGYQAERRQAKPGAGGVLPAYDHMRVERAGTERWLVVDEPAEKLWPAIKEFWQENGFLIKTELPEVGVMETEWAESRARVPEGGIRGLLSRALEQTYTTSERDKYRTRLERSGEGKTTEIYISHYGLEEVYTARDALTNQPTDTRWQPRPSDPEREAEFLRRLMVRLGAQEDRARDALKTAAAEEHARITKGTGGELLVVDEPFDRAWRRVGLALDRVGFTVEDRDRQKGVYFVRYADPEVEANKPGFIDRVFGSSNRKLTAEQYRVQVSEAGSASRVSVLNKDGAADSSKTAQRILALLHEQLK